MNCEKSKRASDVCSIAVVAVSFDGICDGTCIVWKNSVVDPLAFLTYFDSSATLVVIV